jgi:hypothetical protein
VATGGQAQVTDISDMSQRAGLRRGVSRDYYLDVVCGLMYILVTSMGCRQLGTNGNRHIWK